MPDSPAAAVIVPIRNRRDFVSRLLSALEEQTFGDFEVVLVDDGSDDGAPEVAAGRRIGGRTVRVVANLGSGAVAARQTGVDATDAPVLAFTDSDCEPSPRWLELLVDALRDGVGLAHGPTRAAHRPSRGERSTESGDEGLFPSCNLAVRRQAFEEAGGFDPGAADRLGFRPGSAARGLGFGEDTLLAWKVRRARGARYVPEAVVTHAVLPVDWRERVARTWLAGGFPMLVREVPELRRTLLRHRAVLGRGERLPLYVAIAGLLAGRKRVVLTGLGAWAGLRLSEPGGAVPLGRRLAALPEMLVVDAGTAVALVVGMIRAREVVL